MWLRQSVRKVLEAILPRRLLTIRGPSNDTAVCLTFDDGPHLDHTPRLLDLLRQLEIRATFFVVGQQVELYPEITDRIVKEGHAIGGHSFTHSDPRLTTARQFLREIHVTNDLLHRITGKRPTLLRPPHGKLTAGKLLAAWRASQTIVLWNSDPKDFAATSPRQVVDWFREHPLRGGDVVLLHDTHPRAAEVLAELVKEARSRGLQFTTPMRWLG